MSYSLSQPSKKRKIGPTLEGGSKINIISSQLQKLRTDYRKKYMELLQFELEDERVALENRLKMDPKFLENEGLALLDMQAKPVGHLFADDILRFSKISGQTLPHQHQFSNGDMVWISCEEEHFEGLVYQKTKNWLTICCKTILTNPTNKVWRIDRGANRVSHDRMVAALEYFTSSQGENANGGTLFRDLILGYVKDANVFAHFPPPENVSKYYKKENFPDFKSWNLNTSQRQALQAVLAHRLTILQGPPGTGKTHTAVHLIRLLVHLFEGKEKILITADTNVAVDNLLEGLIKFGIKVLRVGQPVKIREEVRDLCLESLIQRHPDYSQLHGLRERYEQLQKSVKDQDAARQSLGELLGRIRNFEANLANLVIRDVDVVCATCIGSAHDMLAESLFRVVIIDECTQATEPASLCPLIKGSQHVVLLGDHYQLPPTVLSHRAEEGGLSESLFQKLIQFGVNPVLLNTQYRMHPSISYFPNQQFYGGKLLDGVTAEEKPAPQGFDWPNPAKPVAFVDVKGKEENTLDGKSKLNKEEALVVLEIVDKFLSEGEISPKDIGIISPYNGMVRHLKSLFLSRGGYEVGQKYHRLVINSVDGFQGREKEVIVVSTVRSNLNGEVGFLKDFRRLNVAITRARRGLIVVGNSETLVCDKNWGDWLEWIRKNDLEFKRKEEQEHDERNEENRKQEETLDERILKKENLTTKKENYEQE